MKSRHLSPVLIVGAGPTGMTAALELAHFGIHSVIVTADQKICDGSRAIAFHQSTIAVWEKLGIGKQILEKGVAWSARHTYIGTKKMATQQFTKAKRGELPRFLNIQQSYVEQFLLEAVNQNPLIELRWNHRVHELKNHSKGVSLCASTPDGAVWLQGAFALACDGARSSMRKMLDLPFPGETFPDRFLIADIRANLDWPQEPRFFFDHPSHPGPTVLIHPQPDGIWRIDWQLGAGADIELERSPERMEKRIRALIGEVAYEQVWLSDYCFHQRILENFRHGRVFFAGDSAHLVAPFGARGLNSAIHDVENLCWKIALVLRGEAPESLLDSYQTERHEAQTFNQKESCETMRFMCPQTPWQRLKRKAILLLAPYMEAARKRVNSGKMCQPFPYSASELLEVEMMKHADKKSGLAIGHKLDDHRCLVSINQELVSSSLRHVLGHGFILLHFAKNEEAAFDFSTKMAALEGQANLAVFTVLSVRLSENFKEKAILDVSNKITAHLGAAQGDCFLIRPDGYLAAKKDETTENWQTILDKACGFREQAWSKKQSYEALERAA